MGQLTTRIDFFSEAYPKISVSFDRSSQWNLGDFNIFWAVASPYEYCRNDESILYCETSYIQKFGYFDKVELGPSADYENWSTKLLIDWTDASASICYVGRLNVPEVLQAEGTLVAFSSNVGFIDPTTVGIGSIDCTKYSFQRKTFFAGCHYVFYSDGGLLYNTMNYDEQWSQPTHIKPSDLHGFDFSVWWDGKYVHYVLTTCLWGGVLLYRRGVINAGEHYTYDSITWESEHTVVTAGGNTQFLYPYVCVDSDGFPWIGFTNWTYIGDYNRQYAFAVKASAKDGSSWTSPVRLSYAETSNVNILPLTGGKVYALYASLDVRMRGRLWNGVSFLNEEYATANVTGSGFLRYSSVAYNDAVHIVFKRSGDIKYVNPSSSGWGNEVLIQADQDSGAYPCMTVDPLNGNLYVFWFSNQTLYMKKRIEGVWDAEASTPFGTDFIVPSGENLVCYYQFWGRRIGVVWREGNPGLYSVRYGYLMLSVNINGQEWYYWKGQGRKKAVITLFGGQAVPALYYGGGVSIFDLFDNVPFYNSYTIEKNDFVEGLATQGFDVLTNRQETVYYAKNHYSTQLIYNATMWLKSQGYNHVFLFGFSAGGVTIAYEIEKSYAASYFDAVLIASAPVNSNASTYRDLPFYRSACNASVVQTPICFLDNVNDTTQLSPPGTWYQMRSYYDNVTVEKEWLNWTQGDDPHVPFPDPSLDDPEIMVLDAAVSFYTNNVRHRFIIKTYATGQGEISNVRVWIDGGPCLSPVNLTLIGEINHAVEVESIFWTIGPQPGTLWKYTFKHWEDSSKANPRTLLLDENKTIIAYYARSIEHWGPEKKEPA